MNVCIDVCYTEQVAITAGVLFVNWRDAEPCDELAAVTGNVHPYTAGQFRNRELEPLLAVLKESPRRPTSGHIWLHYASTAGLGAYVCDALNEGVPVTGVANKRFGASCVADEVLRSSRRPLYVTSAGIDSRTATDNILQMHGEHRVPDISESCRSDRS